MKRYSMDRSCSRTMLTNDNYQYKTRFVIQKGNINILIYFLCISIIVIDFLHLTIHLIQNINLNM
jgi:hypothetical protein